jgi:hypothetical protein
MGWNCYDTVDKLKTDIESIYPPPNKIKLHLKYLTQKLI